MSRKQRQYGRFDELFRQDPDDDERVRANGTDETIGFRILKESPAALRDDYLLEPAKGLERHVDRLPRRLQDPHTPTHAHPLSEHRHVLGPQRQGLQDRQDGRGEGLPEGLEDEHEQRRRGREIGRAHVWTPVTQ